MLRTLDLFILTLIKQGTPTPYGWQARAGVSLGASLPAVKRLLASDLVTEAEKGSRGRREFRITRSGWQALQDIDLNLEEAWDERPTDLESVLRLACMWMSEGKTDLAKKLLLQAAEEHGKRSRRAKRRASVPAKRSSVAELYSAALAHCDASRQEATAKSLAALISLHGLDPGKTAALHRRRKSTR